MRSIVAVMVICFFGLKTQAQAVATPAKDIDKMVVITNLDYDMGRIPFGKPLEYNVTIKNISKDTVILKDVVAGCGCTTPKYRAGEKILPGKSTYITLGFNGSASGDFTKTADIHFNDGTLFKQIKFHGFAVADSTGNNKPVVNK